MSARATLRLSRQAGDHFTTPLRRGFSLSLEGVEFYHGSPYDELFLGRTRRPKAIGQGQRVAMEGHRWLT